MPIGVYERTRRTRAALKEAQNRPDVQRRRSLSLKRTLSTPSGRRRRSLVMREQWKSPSIRRKWLRSMKDRLSDPNYVKKVSKIRSEFWRRPSYRKLRGKQISNQWKDPRFVKSILKSHICPSRPQMSLFKRLCRSFGKGWKLEYVVGSYSIDIAHPGRKIAIEVDGSYWHESRKPLDKRRDRLLRSLGWRVVRISSEKVKQLKHESIQALIAAAV